MRRNVESHENRYLSLKVLVVAASILAAVLVLAACGGGGSSNNSSSTPEAGSKPDEASGREPVEKEAAAGSSASAEIIEPFIGQPSAFPVEEKLKEIPKGQTIAYAECGTPVCALMWELLEPAAQAMGVKVTQVKTGPDAQTLNTGFDTIVQMKPAAVIAVAAEIELWKRQLKELQDEGVTIATTGVANTEPYGIEAVVSGNVQNFRAGELMANYALAEMNPEANVVIYEVPELSFSGQIAEKFTEEVEAKCPGCEARTVEIPVATMGNTSANTIVSDLQSHPETNLAAFTTGELVSGLPSAMQGAGIDVETLAYNPGPTELQYLKEGKLTAGLGFDLPVSVWSLLDMAARGIVNQPLTGPESEGYAVNQFLTQKDITFDPSKGWTGYPDFAERFSKLWGVGG